MSCSWGPSLVSGNRIGALSVSRLSHLLGKSLIFFMIYLNLPGVSYSGEIRLAVAASLNPAISTITAEYHRSHPAISFSISAGGSGLLARQIANGAPFDLYLAASDEWISFLEQAGKVTAGTVAVLAVNRLVFVGVSGSASSLVDLLKFQRIALGSPGSVASGRFAEAALRKAGLYEKLAEQGRLIMAQDVRQALVYADRGEVDGAFVFSTDAALASHVVTLFEVPRDLYPRAICPLALTSSGESNPEAASFFVFLQSAEASAVLQRYGFMIEPARP
ncbi:MAG: molybdate ABC transporter substrate-binding protein [Candidatus Zixiibacteriota bacterium]|nr:MAG: molybdate ABC transporter substrate-binding protein [candidate division Zixibacteria bacterium]